MSTEDYMSFSTYLTEKVTGMAKDKVDEFFEKIKEKVEYENWSNP